MEKISESKPWIKIFSPDLSPPSLGNNTADADRLIKGLKKEIQNEYIKIDFSLVRSIPHVLRKNNYSVNVILFEDQNVWHLIDIFPSEYKKGFFGIAVDLGSSMVVVRLIDLVGKKSIDEISFHNPQIKIGPDILTRIHFAAQEGGLEKLQQIVVEKLNSTIDQLAKKHVIDTRSIVGMTVAGNTTMTHLFMGLDPYNICREPYIPVINKLAPVKSKELGISINSEAPVLLFPNVGSYFGGDLIAGILASGMMNQRETTFLVDVGTNAEVVIGNQDWLMACAGAAGPALEGGVATMGMIAGPGVISSVEINPHTSEFKITAIGGYPPIGICGSGLIDIVAQLFLSGMIDIRGRYVKDKCGTRLMEIDGIKHLTVVPSKDSGTDQALTLSQPDITGLMRSKAAMYTILTTISNTVNIPMKEISRFYIAGTFGSYINPRSAITIGMIPDLPVETYVSLGNTSLEGASMTLLSAQAKDEIFHIRDMITYLELNVNQEFMNLFSAAKFLPHTDISLFPSVKVWS